MDVPEEDCALLREAFEAGRTRGHDEKKGPQTYMHERSEPDFDEWFEDRFGNTPSDIEWHEEDPPIDEELIVQVNLVAGEESAKHHPDLEPGDHTKTVEFPAIIRNGRLHGLDAHPEPEISGMTVEDISRWRYRD